jgi:hypothetical protein
MGVGLMGVFDRSGAVSRRLTARVIRRVVIVASIAAIAVSALAAAGSAESFNNTLSATATPASPAAGSTTTFAVTLKPLTGDELATATITPPAGFTVTGATPANVTTVSGNTVLVHNVSIDPDLGQSQAFSITAVAPCTSAGALSWQVQAKDDDGRNDPVTSSSLGVTLSGTCHLGFVAQPADAAINTAITSTPFNSPMGTSVQVGVFDGANHLITSSTAPISTAINSGTAGATLTGDNNQSVTVTKNAVAGVASFSSLEIDKHGGYTLVASSTGYTSAISTSAEAGGVFTIWDSVQACAANKSCTTTLGDPKTFQTQFSGTSSSGGFLLLTLGQDTLSCGDNFNHAPVVTTATTYNFTATGNKQIVGLISKAVDQLQPNNGVSFYRVCFESDDMTFVYPGGIVRPMGTPYLLPNCKDVLTTPPCVASITKTNAGAVKETITLPKDDIIRHR